MWTDFPDCQGKTGIREENDPSERYPGYGRECADDLINSGMSEFDSRLFAAINDMRWICWPLLPEGTMNNGGNARTGDRESKERRQI